MTQQLLDGFFTEVSAVWQENKGQLRYGQVLFNSLAEVRPDLADQLRGTDLDPFYKNVPTDVDPAVIRLILDAMEEESHG